MGNSCVVCRDDADCGEGLACLQGECVEPPPNACAAPVQIDGPGRIEGSTVDAAAAFNETDAQCSVGQADSQEVAHVFTPEAGGVYCFNTGGSGFDTVLYVREAVCDDPEAERACNDDSAEIAGDLQSALDLELAAGTTYYIFVDGYGLNSSGDYVLTVSAGACEALPPPPQPPPE